jgi:hypothetical protein
MWVSTKLHERLTPFVKVAGVLRRSTLSAENYSIVFEVEHRQVAFSTFITESVELNISFLQMRAILFVSLLISNHSLTERHSAISKCSSSVTCAELTRWH